MSEPMLPLRTVMKLAALTLVATHLCVAALEWSTRPIPLAPVVDGNSDPGPSESARAPAPLESEAAPAGPVAEPSAEPGPSPTPTPTPTPEVGPPVDPDLAGKLEAAGAGASSRGGGGVRVTHDRDVEPVPTLWSLFLPDTLVWLGVAVVGARLVVIVRGRR